MRGRAQELQVRARKLWELGATCQIQDSGAVRKCAETVVRTRTRPKETASLRPASHCFPALPGPSRLSQAVQGSPRTMLLSQQFPALASTGDLGRDCRRSPLFHMVQSLPPAPPRPLRPSTVQAARSWSALCWDATAARQGDAAPCACWSLGTSRSTATAPTSPLPALHAGLTAPAAPAHPEHQGCLLAPAAQTI